MRSTAGSWSNLGPNNTTSGIGRADRLAFHPTDANIVYAGTSGGGLFRTTNGGSSWVNLTPNIPSLGISGIVIDHANASTLYILTGDGDSEIGGLVENYGYMRLSIGVLKSTDNGGTWQKTGDFPGVDYSTLVGYRLVQHPTNSQILYACTNQGLFGSINGGGSWSLLNGNGRFYNLKFQPGSGNVCYAVGRSPAFTRAYFWKSTSSGLFNSWDSSLTINNQINNPTSRVELAVTPANPSVVYLLCGGVPGTGQFKGLYRSANSGTSFSLQSNSPNILGRSNVGQDDEGQSSYDLAVAASNTNSATLITGAIRCWRSLTSGTPGSWDYRGSHHEDVHDLGFHPVDNRLWMANDGGVYSSIDNGATWTSHFVGMNAAQFYRLAVSPDNYQELITGAQDNGLKRRSGITSTFTHVSGADGFAVGYDAADATVFYAIRNRDVFRYTNDGANVANITPNPPSDPNNPFSMGMAPHTTLGNALFIGSDTLWRTTDGGNNWNFNLVSAGWFIRTCPSNGNRIYAAGGNSYSAATGILRRSDDGGVTWPVANILSNKPGFPANYPKITSINVNPSNSLQVWVTFGGYTENVKVYYSADGGLNWSNRSGTLPNLPVNTIAIDGGNNAYVGTDNGVYYRGSGTSEWVPFYNNLPYVPITDLEISEADNRITAATFGRGIWASDLKTTCAADVVVGGTLNGQDFFEASNSVTSTSSLWQSDGTRVQMRGGVQVQLLPGFSAYEGTSFRAMNGPCGSGGVASFTAQRQDAESQSSSSELQASTATKKKVILHLPAATTEQQVLTIRSKTTGELQLSLKDAAGNLIHQWPKEQVAPGTHSKSLTLPKTLAPGLYFVHAWLNGYWQHQQEWEIK
jgi:hypothetical protein